MEMSLLHYKCIRVNPPLFPAGCGKFFYIFNFLFLDHFEKIVWPPPEFVLPGMIELANEKLEQISCILIHAVLLLQWIQ